jgi:hypothetical protein
MIGEKIPLRYFPGIRMGIFYVYLREKFLTAGIRDIQLEDGEVFSFENEILENRNYLSFGFHKNGR